MGLTVKFALPETMSASNSLPSMDESRPPTMVSFCQAVAVPLENGLMFFAFSAWVSAIISSQVFGGFTPASLKIFLL